MDPLGATASIIQVTDGTIKILSYLNDVKNAPKEKAQYERELSKLYSLLVTLKSRLYMTDEKKEWNRAVKMLDVEHGPFEQYKLALEQMQAAIETKSQIRSALKWSFDKAAVKGWMARISDLNIHIQIVLQLDLFALSRSTKEDTLRIKDIALDIKSDTVELKHTSTQIQNDTAKIKQYSVDTHLQKALDWISSTNHEAQHNDLLSRREEGTGEWFIDNTKFKIWKQQVRGTLFCEGIPGAGKTMLSAIAIEHLQQSESEAGIAYMYCNYQKDLTNMDTLGSMLKQLVQQKPLAGDLLLTLFQEHKEGKSLASLREIITTLGGVMSMFPWVYIVVDALDECPEQNRAREQLIQDLKKLQVSYDMRLMATSRPIPKIAKKFSDCPVIEVRASKTDVRSFVAAHIHVLPRKVQEDSVFVSQIMDTIVNVVDGMFLLAQFYVDRLSDTLSKRDVKTILQALPTFSGAADDAYNVYSEIYEQTMERIDNQAPPRKKLARHALYWIVHAQRPMEAKELCVALAVEPEDDDLDEDGITDIVDVLSACVGLLVVEKETLIVRLVHYTTQEYFQNRGKPWLSGACEYLAATCLTFLRFRSTKPAALQDLTHWDYKVKMSNVPFLEYALLFWSQHLQPCQKVLADQALAFLENEVVRFYPARVYTIRRTYPSNPSLTRLHITAAHGLKYLFQLLIAETSNSVEVINILDSSGATPLYYAAGKGHTEMVQQVLTTYPEVYIDCFSQELDRGCTPLLTATERSHDDVVKLLLDHGANTERTDSVGDGPVHLAVKSGTLSTVKLLIEEYNLGVQETWANNWGLTPLDHAAKSNITVFEYLFDRAKARGLRLDNKKDNILHRCAKRGSDWAVEYLLGTPLFDINARGLDGRTALHYAAKHHNTKVVEVLMQHKSIKLEVKCDLGLTPLATAVYWAVVTHRLQTVKCLIEHGADIRCKDGKGNSLLCMAAGYRKTNMYLVENVEVDLNEKNSAGWAAVGVNAAMIVFGSRRMPVSLMEIFIKYHNVDDAMEALEYLRSRPEVMLQGFSPLSRSDEVLLLDFCAKKKAGTVQTMDDTSFLERLRLARPQMQRFP